MALCTTEQLCIPNLVQALFSRARFTYGGQCPKTHLSTDLWFEGINKQTDVSWDIFIIWKINFGQWAVSWAGL